MENSLLFIFDEIWPEIMYYSTGTLAGFWSKFKILKKSNFDRNQLKLYMQYKHVHLSKRYTLRTLFDKCNNMKCTANQHTHCYTLMT